MPASTPRAQRSLNPARIASAMKKCVPAAPSGTFSGMKPLGFIELYKLPGEKGNEYLARSEQARWYVKVLSSLGEPVEQDLSGVLK